MTDQVDVYPVGLLSDLKRLRADWWYQGRRAALSRFAYQFRVDWRRRNYWDGYHAEVQSPAACGHGWTKARARLDLARHVAQRERAK